VSLLAAVRSTRRTGRRRRRRGEFVIVKSRLRPRYCRIIYTNSCMSTAVRSLCRRRFVPRTGPPTNSHTRIQTARTHTRVRTTTIPRAFLCYKVFYVRRVPACLTLSQTKREPLPCLSFAFFPFSTCTTLDRRKHVR